MFRQEAAQVVNNFYLKYIFTRGSTVVDFGEYGKEYLATNVFRSRTKISTNMNRILSHLVGLFVTNYNKI